MATRQYIGARYIPIFADPVEWDSTNAYQYLTMVQHQGETYMSRQAVPVGISLPDTEHGEESNEYWVHMSNWNAQVETYRQEVLLYNGRITTLENDLPIADFDSTNTVKKAIDGLQDQLGNGFDSTNTVTKVIADETLARENGDFIRAVEFANVASMKTSADLEDGMFVHTCGFHQSGDGGAAYYIISDTGTANEMNVIACGDLFATLVDSPIVNPLQYGCVADGTTDDYSILNFILANGNVKVDFQGKSYYSEQCLQIADNTECYNGTFKFDLGSTYGYDKTGLFNCIQAENLKFHEITIIGTGSLSEYSDHYRGFNCLECDNVTISNCVIKDFQSLYCILFDQCTNVAANANHIENYSFSGIMCMNGNTDVEVCDNTVLYCTNSVSGNSYPISLCGFDDNIYKIYTTKNARCCNNYVENKFPYWEGIDSHGGTNMVIEGNVIKGCMTGISIATSTVRGNNISIANNVVEFVEVATTITTFPNLGIAATYCNNVTMTGNVVKKSGIFQSTNTIANAYRITDAENVVLDGNVADAYKGTGVYMSAVDKIHVSNNILISDDSNNTSFAFFLASVKPDTAGNVIVENNFCRGNRYAKGPGNISPYGAIVFILRNNDVVNPMDRSGESTTICDRENYSPDVAGRKSGVKGFIVYNNTPASGQPLGWICTASGTSSTDATWAALPNL